MSAETEPPPNVIERLSFRSRTLGRVKLLEAFDKSRHTVPDAVNPATSGFLAKLCADELQTEAENFFQKTRATFGYKRKEISLSVASPMAELTTTDFVLELAYALHEADPSEWSLTRTLHPKTGGTFLQRPECDELFAGLFCDLVFALSQGVQIDAVIDAVEELGDPEGLRVDYPSDCSECELTVPDVEAKVRMTGGTLEMVFPRPGCPRELLAGFLAVRHRFRLTEDVVLRGVIG
jgi:hypothetical protein